VSATLALKPEKAMRAPGKHVVHGVLSLDLGGLERLVLDLVKHGAGVGNRVTVVCVERPGKLAGRARELGAEVVCLDKPAGRSQRAVADAERVLRELRPDVLHTHQIGALWYLGQAARRVGLECVVHTEHSDHVRQAKTWLGKVRARYLWWRGGRLARQVCCVSADVAAAMQHWGTVPAGRVSVVLNGIDTEVYGNRAERDALRRELGLPEEAVVIGTVGRLAEVKRQDLLLEAFAQLAGEFANLRLLLVGEGPEREALESLAERLGVREKVVFAGYQANPERFLAAMDLFALTSRHEALPLSLLEAWASGLPVASSAVGGIPKVVEDGVTGLLFPSGKQAELVHCLRRLLTDATLRARLSAAGKSQVQAQYSLVRMARDYDRAYTAAGLMTMHGCADVYRL
jgi:glycosyltransferase involved in cell wall biosynthesis